MINIWSKILCFRHLSKEIHILNDNKTGWWCSSTNPLMVENIKSLIQLTFQLFSSFSVGLNVYQWSHTERINGAKNRFKLLNGYRKANDRKTSDIVIRDYWLYCSDRCDHSYIAKLCIKAILAISLMEKSRYIIKINRRCKLLSHSIYR